MKTKTLIRSAVVLGAAVFASAAMANSIVLQQNVYSFSDGGEFTAITTPDLTGGYASAATLNGGFQTFCVEASVWFYPGVTYTFNLSDTDSQGRSLSLGAAYLYYQFATGSLAGYDYNNTANRRACAGLLQSALWELQGHQSGGGTFPTGGSGNVFYDLAVTHLGAGNIYSANNNAYPVEIVQIWDRHGETRQNQLVLNPNPPRGGDVPDGGTTSAMFAIGLAGLGMTGRLLRRTGRSA